MDRNEWLAKTTPLMSHPRMDGVSLEDVSCKKYDFDRNRWIPAVLVCLVTERQYCIWNGTVINGGLSLLMMRRGFEVGAITGVWSMIAGIRDLVSSKGSISVHSLSILTVLKEIGGETGIPVTKLEDEIFSMGSFHQINPENSEQWFVNEVFFARVKPGLTPGILLCHEHSGAVWVPIESIREFCNNPLRFEDEKDVENKKNHPVLSQVVKDGMAPNMREVVFPTLLNYLDSI